MATTPAPPVTDDCLEPSEETGSVPAGVAYALVAGDLSDLHKQLAATLAPLKPLTQSDAWQPLRETRPFSPGTIVKPRTGSIGVPGRAL